MEKTYLEICSPKSGFVTAVSVATGKLISQGDALLQLDTIEEDKNLERLNHLLAVHQIAAQKYVGTQFDQACKISQSVVDSAQDLCDFAQRNYDGKIAERDVLHDVGEMALYDKKIDLDKAKIELLQLQADLEKMKATAANYMQTADLLRKHIEFEKAQLEKQKALLTMVAPVSGVVSLRVAGGSFIKMGHVLLTIES